MLDMLKKTLLIIVLYMGYLCHAEDSTVVVNVNKGVLKPVSIAINAYEPSEQLREKMLKVINNDLQSTFLFRSIPEAAFLQNLRGVAVQPNFALWKTINSQYLANLEIHREGGLLKASMVIYDVLGETAVGRFSISAAENSWRKIAHRIANNIYERITGEQGYFDTKILYVSVQKKNRSKIHRIALMDQDGHNHEFLTGGESLVLTPRYAPNGQEISYFTYQEKIVNGRRVPIAGCVYRLNLLTQRHELLARFQGMTYAPRYSPSGNLLVFSLSRGGSSSIYTLDLLTKRVTRLTKGRCIDTSPCYSPDGKYIVFNSDRGGTQQIYIMDADGSNVRRLSFGKGRYATPVWSPRGDWIAFTKFGKDGFFIGVIRPDGSGERMLASGNLVEGPTWSPNGRVIMFSHQDYANREKIFSVDITGYNKHEIATPYNAIDPEWSTHQL